MRIGVAGPATMDPLKAWLGPGTAVPDTYSFPYISQLVIGYLEAGHEVDLYTSSSAVSEPMILGDGPLRVYVGRRRDSAKARAFDFFRLERIDIANAIRLSEPDVVHAHWLYEFAGGALAVRPDALITAHDSPYAIVRYYKHPYWWFRAALGLNTLRRARNLTVVSPALGGETRLPRPRGQNKWLIPNGINIDAASLASDKAVLAGGPVVFASIANGFDDRKNTATAIAAFGMYRTCRPRSTLLMFGKDHQRGGPAHLWATERGLSEGVDFRGDTDHRTLMQILLEKVQVLLHTSRWEACSLAVIECLARGIPVVGGARSGGMPYSIGEGSAGVLVDISSASEVTEAMVAVTADPTSYKKLSQAGKLLAKERFSFGTVVAHYLEILKDISDCSIQQQRTTVAHRRNRR